MTLDRAPKIACIGLSSWDRLIAVPEYPPVGEQAIVLEEVSAPGGTTTNTAVALARLGARVAIATAIGDDERGSSLRRSLEEAGVDTAWLTVKAGQKTDLATVIVSRQPLERTILGPLTYLADKDLSDAFDLALRHDTIVSNERDLLEVTGTWTLGDAVAALQSRMRGADLRAALITRGGEGCRVVTETTSLNVPAFSVEVVDPTGAGDAFVAGVAWGMAQRWSWPEVGRFANAVGALACCELGAQTSLPTVADVQRLLASTPAGVD
jgi:sugar/nucleoside kinase (ribokinase family)